jgi:hypothetical protein
MIMVLMIGRTIDGSYVARLYRLASIGSEGVAATSGA